MCGHACPHGAAGRRDALEREAACTRVTWLGLSPAYVWVCGHRVRRTEELRLEHELNPVCRSHPSDQGKLRRTRTCTWQLRQTDMCHTPLLWLLRELRSFWKRCPCCDNPDSSYWSFFFHFTKQLVGFQIMGLFFCLSELVCYGELHSELLCRHPEALTAVLSMPPLC